MPYIAPEVVAKAKEMDLLTYLRSYDPQELVRVNDNEYTTKTHDSLRISTNGLWNWCSQGIGGKNALKYLIDVRGIPFQEAVNMIIGQADFRPPVFVPKTEHQPKKLLLPIRCADNRRMEAYLRGRGIDRDVIRFFEETGRLYEGAYTSVKSGRTFIHAVFVGFDKDGTARYANLRGIDSGFKGDATGSDKRYSFSLSAKYSRDTLHLYESAIDLLSDATLMKMEGRDWRGENMLSLAGVYQPKSATAESKIPAAITRFLDEHPHVRRIVFHLDNDPAGRMATAAIATILRGRYEVVDDRPKHGKDVNACLCHMIRNKDRSFAR